MSINLDALRQHLESLTEEEKTELAKMLQGEEIPKGWVSIEEHLPKWKAADLAQGYSNYQVKDAEGNEFWTSVSDHGAWYYYAKERGFTHWLND